MDILLSETGRWVIIHGGKRLKIDFATEAEAWAWADSHIDDQVFGEPNWYSEPLEYAEAQSK
jgi:hypothetical protein